MPEVKRPEVRRFIKGLLPIKGVDFTKPWKDIVLEINPQLIAQRYEPFDKRSVHKVMIGDLNNPGPENPDTFDPLIIDSIYDTPETHPMIRAAAKLGLQAHYWKGLSEALSSPLGEEHIPYQDWQSFVVQPVYAKGDRYFLKPYISEKRANEFSDIQYGGDGDMISFAKGRTYDRKGLSIPFADLGIPDAWLDEYIGLRERMDTAQDKAMKEAVLYYRENNKDEWEALKKTFTNLDEFVDANENFGAFFLNMGHELAKKWLASTYADSEIPGALVDLIGDIRLSISEFLKRRISPRYGIELFRGREFYESVVELSTLTKDMYEAALDSLY